MSKMQEFMTILESNSDKPDALRKAADYAFANGRPDLAIKIHTKALVIDGDCPKTLLKRGEAYAKQGILSCALRDFDKSIQMDPNSAETYFARGTLLARNSNFDKAIEDFSAAISFRPTFSNAFYNRGLIYQKKQLYDQAIIDYTSAISLDKKNVHALNNRGIAHREQKKYSNAIDDFAAVLAQRPSFAQTHWNKALTHFMVGDYPSAWKHFEKRWDNPVFTSPKRPFTEPLWLGKSNLQNKTILLHSEQGLGDSIQYCRYVKLVQKLAGTVFLEVERPLATLMRSLLPSNHIFTKGDALPQFDFHCPLMSLPKAFQTTINSVPFAKPYLHVSGVRANWWRNQLSSIKGQKIGIVWQGNPKHPNDAKRSIPLKIILDELTNDVSWISLQKELSAEDAQIIQKQDSIIHFGDLIGDFLETGALCKALDAVVCVDTSIAHLAGAIGKKVHLMLPYVADSRWHENRTDSPWYSYIQLYRQDEKRCWKKPLSEVMQNLSNLT